MYSHHVVRAVSLVTILLWIATPILGIKSAAPTFEHLPGFEMAAVGLSYGLDVAGAANYSVQHTRASFSWMPT